MIQTQIQKNLARCCSLDLKLLLIWYWESVSIRSLKWLKFTLTGNLYHVKDITTALHVFREGHHMCGQRLSGTWKDKDTIRIGWGDIEMVMLLRGSLSNSYPEDKSSQKTALNQPSASAVLAMLCQGSHREEHRVSKMTLKQKRGERGRVKSRPFQHLLKWTQTSALKLLLCSTSILRWFWLQEGEVALMEIWEK